ncbi:hypothetical protein LCGC14_0439560 [marine sediment metagenome]|uniref:Uncharacterized protein n=1 Tax=marine sediment metagenome TaxID=412755 RepID=A0A0F9VV85_9ZZZZ
MAGCELLDWRCIFVSEIAGSAFLAALLALMFYFIIASRLNWGFNTTIGFLFPILLITGLALTGFSVIMAFATVILGFMLAWIFNKLIGNR